MGPVGGWLRNRGSRLASAGVGALLTLGLGAAVATAQDEPSAGVTVSKLGSGTGTVASTPAGIDCGATCFAPFDEATEVTLTATPDEGSRFGGWSGDCTGAGECVVAASTTASVTATFIRQREVTLHAIGAGAITAEAPPIFCTTTECGYTVDDGTEITLTATAVDGHRFVGWDGQGCSGTATTCVVTLDADRAIVAYFAEREPALAPPTDPAPIFKLPPDTRMARAKVTSEKRKALFRFEGVWGAAPPAGFTCRLDKQRWKPCESPVTFRRLDYGKHVFRVASVRDDGVVDSTPAKHHFKIAR